MALTLDQALGQLEIAAVGFQRIEVAGTILPPAARDQVHFIAVLSGSGQLDSAQGPIRVTAGQLLLLGADDAPSPGAGLVVAHGLLGAKLLDGRSLFDLLPLPHLQEAGGTELLTGAIPEMLKESAYGGAGSAAILTCLARRLITALVRVAWPAAGEIPPADITSQQKRLGQIVELFRTDPARDYSLDRLAHTAGMSRTMFHRLFTQTYGSSPLALLRELRLKRAEELLLQTDLQIKNISARLGYRSRSHFWKLFRDTRGVDPEQFRQRAKERQAHA